MHISEILAHKDKTDLVSVSLGDSLERASQIMTAKAVGALLVKEGGRLSGIISERDVVHAVAHHGQQALQYKVDAAMTHEVLTCRPSDSVRDVMMLMTSRRIRHVPVTNGEQIVAMVSIGDLLKWRIHEQGLEVAILRDLSLSHL